jgi:signal transduction histidine kinase
MTDLLAARRPWHSSVRARIALACAGLFLVLGATLIGVTYTLVGHVTSQRPSAPPAGLGIPGPPRSVRSGGGGAQDQAMAERRDFLLSSLVGLGLGTVLAGGLGWAVSGRVLRPLTAITAVARAASQENLGRRLALGGPPDELKELADTFDAMLARLDAAFASQQRFVANASHELRTPLTEMRTLIDVTLAKPAVPAGQLELTMGAVRAAVDKNEELVEALLTLARSDRGLGATEVVDLPTAVEDAIDLISASAAAKHIRIETALQDTRVTGDRVLLERLVTNLMTNAVHHNVAGGWVLASTRIDAGVAELAVANGGEQIPPEQVPGLFDPFRRLDGRAGSRQGTGLGLSIVASVARAHSGHAEAHARPDGGLEVQVTLPVARHAVVQTARR